MKPKKYFLTQLFQRNVFAARKISLTLKFDSSPSLLLRVPFDAKHEFEVFKQVNKVSSLDKVIKSSIPKTKVYDKPFPLIAQTWINGRKVFLSENSGKVASWVSVLHQKTTIRSSPNLNNHLLAVIKRVSPVLSIGELNKLKLSLAQTMNVLNKEVCFCHGDLTPFNILDQDGKIFVIDWEDFEPSAHYLYDLIHFRFFEERMKVTSLENTDVESFVEKVLNPNADLFKYYYKNVKREQLDAYFPFYLANRLMKYKDSLKVGVWKKKYYDFYLKLLKHYLGSHM